MSTQLKASVHSFHGLNGAVVISCTAYGHDCELNRIHFIFLLFSLLRCADFWLFIFFTQSRTVRLLRVLLATLIQEERAQPTEKGPQLGKADRSSAHVEEPCS